MDGSYYYETPQGQRVTVFYKADENGYVPGKVVFGDEIGKGFLASSVSSGTGFGYSKEPGPVLRIGPAAVASLTGGGIG